MENIIGAVEKAAREENGWRAIAVSRSPAAEGLRPNGFIAFMRESAPWDDRRGGTAAWARIEETGNIVFIHGNYDLGHKDTLLDFTERTDVHAKAYAKS